MFDFDNNLFEAKSLRRGNKNAKFAKKKFKNVTYFKKLYSRTTIFIDKKNSSKLWKRGIHCRLHSTQFCFQVKIKRTTTEQIQCAI